MADPKENLNGRQIPDPVPDVQPEPQAEHSVSLPTDGELRDLLASGGKGRSGQLFEPGKKAPPMPLPLEDADGIYDFDSFSLGDEEDLPMPPPENTAEDIRDFERELGGQDPKASYIDEPAEDGMRRYSGMVGSFTYDPAEWQVQLMDIPASEFGQGGCREVLRYIGNEKDGMKIEIPQGVTDTSFMFKGSDIKAAPDIPVGVKRMDFMFEGCHDLEDGRVSIPPTVENAAFAFANCEKMTSGPKAIPGSVRNADYMFAACASMRSTPKIGAGVESINGTFMGCRSLSNAPKIPKTVKQANYATMNCTGIDKERDKKQAKDMEKARKKFEKKLDKPGILARVGSMASAVMQTHALRKMGYGVVAAPLMAHQMRKSGAMGKDFSSGVATVAMTKGGAMGHMIYRSAMDRSKKNEQKRVAKRQERLAQWDRLYGQGSEFSGKMKRSAAKGSKDAKRGLFNDLPRMETCRKDIYRETHGRAGMYAGQEDTLARIALANQGMVPVQDQRSIAQWYKNQMKDKVGYFTEAQATLDAKGGSKRARAEAARGMTEMKSIMLEPLAASMQSVQDKYVLFNEGDKREIDRMMKGISGQTVFGTDRPDYQAQASQVMKLDNMTFRQAPEVRDMNRSADVTEPSGKDKAATKTPDGPVEGHGRFEPARRQEPAPEVSEVSRARAAAAESMFGNIMRGAQRGASKENDGPDV